MLIKINHDQRTKIYHTNSINPDYTADMIFHQEIEKEREFKNDNRERNNQSRDSDGAVRKRSVASMAISATLAHTLQQLNDLPCQCVRCFEMALLLLDRIDHTAGPTDKTAE